MRTTRCRSRRSAHGACTRFTWVDPSLRASGPSPRHNAAADRPAHSTISGVACVSLPLRPLRERGASTLTPRTPAWGGVSPQV
jgi:hypothetical protein